MSLTKASYSMITGAPVNVLDFGVVGDGVTDDTASIQAAITAGAGKTVFFPTGTYKTTAAITVPSFTSLVGSRGTVTTHGAGTIIHCTNSNVNMFNIPNGDWAMSDLTLYHNSEVSAGSGHILNLGVVGTNFCSGGQATRVTFYTAPQGAVCMNNAGDTIFTDCRWEVNTYSVIAATAAGVNAGDMRFVNCVFYANYIDIFANYGVRWMLSNCLFQLTGDPGYSTPYSSIFDGTANAIAFSNCIFDRCTGALKFNVGQNTVNGCQFLAPKRGSVWLSGTTNYSIISNNIMLNGSVLTANTFDGILMDATPTYNILTGNNIASGFRYGINITAGSLNNSVRSNTVTTCATANFNDVGTDTKVNGNDFGNSTLSVGAFGFYPPQLNSAIQTTAGLYANNGVPNNALGNNGDVYFRGDGGALSTVYQKRGGAWVGIV